MQEDMNALEPIKDAPLPAAQVVASVALNMALKYHDIGTVSDGALYQQYKLEGRDLIPLNLQMVFDTAIAMEKHLLSASDRIAAIVCEALYSDTADDERAKGE